MSVNGCEGFEDGRDEWCNLSNDRVMKSVKIFGVDGLEDLLGEGSLEK